MRSTNPTFGKAFTKILPTISVVILGVSGNLKAQDLPALEVIIVTAQKRAQPLQDVPISVSVLDGNKLQDSGAERLHDISSYVPNFSVQSTPIGDLISIRGIQSGSQAGFEQSVSTFVDGVHRGRSIQSRFAFLDVDLLEFLRGPQVTLFGKNTIAGVMNIRSARPTTDFSSEISVGYNDKFDENELTGYISGPITESVRARFAFTDHRLDEGWVDNSFYDQAAPAINESAYRLSLEWNASQSTNVFLRHDIGTWEDTGAPWVLRESGSLSLFGVDNLRDFSTTMGNDARTTESVTGIPAAVWGNSEPIEFGTPGYIDGDSSETLLTINHELTGGAEIDFILANSEYEFERFLDADFGPLPTLRFDDSENYEQQSLEVRLTSNSESGIEYMLGGYIQQADLEADGVSYFNSTTLDFLLNGSCAIGGGVVPVYSGADLNANGSPDPFDALLETVFQNAALNTSAETAFACGQSSLLDLLPSLDGVNRYSQLDQESDIWAVFGQLTWALTADLDASIGIRYTDEDKSASKLAHASDYLNRNIAATKNPEVALLGTVLGEFTPHLFPDLNRNETNTSWSANLQWKLDQDTLLYSAVSTGAKAGGFNTFYFGNIAGVGASADDAEFEGEEVTSYEIGAKLSLPRHSLELNIAVFRTEFDDLQAAVFTGGTTFVVRNAAEATSQGIEFDGRWQPLNNLMLLGSFGLVDFKYEEFPNQACTISQLTDFRETAWDNGANPLAALINNSSCSAAGVNDLSGRQSYNTPEFKSSIVSRYSIPIGNYEFVVAIDVNWQDDLYRAADLDPISRIDGYTMINSEMSFGPMDGQWDVSLVGRNVANKRVFSYIDDTPLFTGTYQGALQRPRHWSIRGRFRF